MNWCASLLTARPSAIFPSATAIAYTETIWKGPADPLTEDGSFIAKNPKNEVVTRGRTNLKKMYENLVSDVQPRPRSTPTLSTCAARTPRPVDATSRCTA